MNKLLNPKIKYLCLLFLWILAGYVGSNIFIRYISPQLVPIISDLLRYINSLNSPFNSLFFKDFVLFFFSNILSVLLASLLCYVLAKITDIKKIWVVGFILGFITISMYVHIDSLLFYYFEFDKIPDYELKPSIIGFVVDLIIIPIACVLGCSLGCKNNFEYQL